jgi:hypothetical protein
MKGKKKSGLWEYLSKSGALDAGPEAIALAKAAYYRRYRKEWIASKRRACRKFTVYLEAEEWRTINTGAKASKRSITRFLKEASLAYLQQRYLVPDVALVGSVHGQLAMINAGLGQLFDRSFVNYQDYRQLAGMVRTLEQLVLQELVSPQLLEERIKEEIQDDPGFKERIIDHIQSMEP